LLTAILNHAPEYTAGTGAAVADIVYPRLCIVDGVNQSFPVGLGQDLQRLLLADGLDIIIPVESTGTG
jgi:hypothetical protein